MSGFYEVVSFDLQLLVHWSAKGKPNLENRIGLTTAGFKPETVESLYQSYLTEKLGDGRKSKFSMIERRELSTNGGGR